MARKASEEYLKKLRDPRWQKLRLEVMERDEWTCQVCGDTSSTLNVHHRYYIRNAEPWECPAHALITFCETCHQSETDCLYEAGKQLLNTLRESGAMSGDFDALMCAFAITAGHPPLLDQYDWSLIAWKLEEMFIERRRLGAWGPDIQNGFRAHCANRAALYKDKSAEKEQPDE